jgi:hypothetical protein
MLFMYGLIHFSRTIPTGHSPQQNSGGLVRTPSCGRGKDGDVGKQGIYCNGCNGRKGAAAKSTTQSRRFKVLRPQCRDLPDLVRPESGMFTHDRPDGFIVGEDLPDGNLVVADLGALNASHLPQRALRARRSQRIKRVGTGCSCLKFPS